MSWYLIVLKKYAVFSGRARRKEYWMFSLFNFFIGFILAISGELTGIIFDTSGDIYTIAIFIPTVAVSIRRMHDIGKNGWFWLFPIYNIILFAREGIKGDNQYGADPKADALDIQTS